jgi:hypothetical protein
MRTSQPRQQFDSAAVVSGHSEAMPTKRRFPAPWSVEEQDACFVVRDHGGQALGYFYFEEEPGRQSAVGCMALSFTIRSTLFGSTAITTSTANDRARGRRRASV